MKIHEDPIYTYIHYIPLTTTSKYWLTLQKLSKDDRSIADVLAVSIDSRFSIGPSRNSETDLCAITWTFAPCGSVAKTVSSPWRLVSAALEQHASGTLHHLGNEHRRAGAESAVSLLVLVLVVLAVEVTALRTEFIRILLVTENARINGKLTISI